MRKVLSFLLALALVFSLGASASAQTPGAELQTVACPEQGFSLQCAKDYIWKYSKTDGITIYTEHEGSIPYVLVFRAEDWLVEAAEYIEEQFTPYMKGKYGKDLVAAEEFEHFRIGGRDLAVGLYTYRLQGYLIDMVRAYDVQDRQTVVFTAKWIRGQGEATMDALTLAVRSFRPDLEYYEAAAANPRWAYTVTTTPGGEECYAFSDFQVTLPEDWKGKVCVAIHERSVSFYQAESYHLWQEKEGYAGGHLFSVGYSESEDFRNLPSFSELGKAGKGWYFLIYPPDFQPYADSERAVEEYKEMYGEISFIRDNAACF